MYTGPHIIKDGLVFGYDTGYGIADNVTGTRFYPGKPTSNALETEANWIYLGTNITNPSDYPVSLPAEVNFQKGASQGSASWSDACRNYADSYSAGTKITVSGWHMFHSTDISLSMSSRDRLGWHYSKDGVSTYGGTIYTATEWNKWYYFSSTFSSTGVTTNLRVEDGGPDYYRSSEDAAKTTQYYCNLQIEVGTDVVSPYIKGSRSSTASLIDLKETTNINVSNVSFDSTGQPDFDGTDDYFTTSGLTTNSSASVSFETIIKFDGTLDSNDRKVFHWDKTNTSNGVAQIRKGTNNGRLMYQHHNGTSWYTLSVDNVVTSDTYIHILLVHSGTTATMYKNGVQVGTTTVSNLEYTNAGEILIGYRTSSEYWKGEIPIFKVYDKALTTAEIKQNYNAYKNRFDI
jgi:hypothetical protein